MERQAVVGGAARRGDVGVVSVRGGGVQSAHALVPHLHCGDARALLLV